MVRTDPNRGGSHWFEPKVRSVSMVRSDPRLLPIKYNFSAEYCLSFCRLLLLCFQNESGTTANACNPINKPRNFIIRKVTHHICSKIRRLRSTRIKDSASFYPHKQTTALNGANQAFPWCASPLGTH